MRIRILVQAEALERRTKAKGKQAGAIGQSGLRVLRTLMFEFSNIATGRCDPGYRSICRSTGFCRQTVSNALKRLEAAGLVEITRRMVRAGKRAVQITNAYAFAEVPALSVQAVLEVRSKPQINLESKRATRMPELSTSLRDALSRLGEKLGFIMPPETTT